MCVWGGGGGGGGGIDLGEYIYLVVQTSTMGVLGKRMHTKQIVLMLTALGLTEVEDIFVHPLTLCWKVWGSDLLHIFCQLRSFIIINYKALVHLTS